MTQLKSVIERDLPGSHEAEAKLGALRAQGRDFAIACVLSLVGAVVAIAVDPRLEVILFAVAVGTGLLCGRAVWRRQELLVLLLAQRDAYAIPAVRRRAQRFATEQRRHRLGAWLRKIVAVADGEQRPPSSTVRIIDARVRSRRDRLLKLADALDDDAREVHPASLALLHQTLTRPGFSPLYNVGLKEDLVDLVLHRVEGGVEPHL